ncbi:transcriptional regulator FilR1 domain-containing protein [Halorubellus litoreus]|uniref:Helix-turn-helix transcriptional regulator n=1 Tax=Halorubellus litoreus TaxID=755308 RepID=A0ABD5VB25_9EURY
MPGDGHRPTTPTSTDRDADERRVGDDDPRTDADERGVGDDDPRTDADERGVGDDDPVPGSPVLESVLENARNRRHLGTRLAATGDRLDADALADVVRHGPVLEALLAGPMDRREIEAHLNVSRATSHRLARWLDEHEFVEKDDGRLHLTGRGEAVAEEVLRFEATVRTADRLAPLLDAVCPDHQEFVLEPFVDATVTVADPDDPYRPVERFAELAADSETFRGFNTTPMTPPVRRGRDDHVLDGTETEVVYRRSAAEKLLETAPERARDAIAAGHLTIRTRETLPYGLAVFDDRVGIAGYDDRTGLATVFVDTDDDVAREWGERVYRAVRADADPLDARTLED